MLEDESPTLDSSMIKSILELHHGTHHRSAFGYGMAQMDDS
jgi:hypothetical protein